MHGRYFSTANGGYKLRVVMAGQKAIQTWLNTRMGYSNIKL